MIELAVVSRAHDEEVLIADHIRSLFEQAQEMAGLAKINFHIVANGCTDSTVGIAEATISDIPNLDDVTWQVWDLPKPSSTAALNWGIANSTGGIIATTDSDNTLGPGSLIKVVSALARPGVHLAGAVNDTLVPPHLRNRGIGYLSRTHTLRSGLCGWYPMPVAALMAYRRSLLDDTGPHDEKVVSSEDTRMGLRVIRLFGTQSVVVCLDAFAYSVPPVSVTSWLRMKSRHFAGHGRMLQAEPELAWASDWREQQLGAIRARTSAMKAEVLALMEEEGIPLETLDLLDGRMTVQELFQYLARYEPPQLDSAGHWAPSERPVLEPA